MRIAVFGMGYVGCVSAAVLACEGHDVVGVDTNRAKVDALRRGESPIVEPSLGDLVRRAHGGGRLTATSDGRGAARDAAVILVCVGTPSAADGATDVSALQRVVTDIGGGIAGRRDFPVVALRSTALPFVIDDVVVATLERVSDMRRGVDFGFVVNPEFLREGSGVEDFEHPPFTVLGTGEDRTAAVMTRLYEFLRSPVVVVDPPTAALVKYACNAFHALKVAFANEIDLVARMAGVDGGPVMQLVCMDEKLNLSAAYLRPGMPFGGSCLPKDVRALAHFGRTRNTSVPLLAAILDSNRRHVDACVQRILAHGRRRVGIFGMAFKAETDDVRESPTIALVEALLEKGLDLALYDGRVSLARLVGANREFVDHRLPQLAALLRPSIEAVIRESDVLVVANGASEFETLGERLRPGQVLVDLAGTLVESRRAASVRSGT